MPASPPAYYTSLTPFRDLFATGVPILTYHKFGRRPRGVRLRGLYLPTALLRRQLAELRQAGFQTAGLGEVGVAGPVRRIVLTIDDGFRSVLLEALPQLVAAGFQATLYLVADRLGGSNDWEVAEGEARAPLMDEGEVREWLAAGQRIGSHTLTHPYLTRVPLSVAREEVRASRRKLEDRFGVPVTDFCYPYGDWNAEVREEVVSAGYATATTTDFGINDPAGDPWALRRVTARHASWGWRSVRAWWRRRWPRSTSG